jgi:hypothetical protein
MDQAKKFELNEKISRAAALILICCFAVSFVFTLLPRLPDYPTAPHEWRWFVISWNLGGPLMFIMVFRLHALRVLQDVIKRGRPTLGITLWVKFWLGVAMFFGLATLSSVVHNYSTYGFSPFTYLDTGCAATIAAWLALVMCTLSLTWMKPSKRVLHRVKRAREINRWLLAPSSLIFFVFTGLSSILMLFPT